MALKPLINLVVVRWGGVAVATTTTALFLLYAVLIGWAITRVMGNYFNKELLTHLLKILGAGAAAFAAYLLWQISGIQLLSGVLSFVPALGICAVVYVGVIWATGLVKVLLPKKSEQE